MAALSALQLRTQPFTEAPADGDLFVDQNSTDMLSDINEALISGDDVLLIMGPTGSGKTTLLNQLSASSNSRITCFSVKGSSRFNSNTLFVGMLDAFKCEAPDDLKLALDELIPNLQALTDKYNRLSTIVIDDAEQVPEAELTKLLSSLLYINSHDDKLLRVLLAAESEFEEKIPEMLPEGADLPYASLTIEPFDAMRSKAYLEFRLNQAGYFDEFPFTDKQIINMHEAGGGYPHNLHVAAAAELNEQHGGFEGGLPPELMSESRDGAGRGKLLKYVLGGAALLMIGAGALSFMKGDGKNATDGRYKVVETKKVDTTGNESINLNKPETDTVAVDASTEQDNNTDTENTPLADASTSNTEQTADNSTATELAENQEQNSAQTDSASSDAPSTNNETPTANDEEPEAQNTTEPTTAEPTVAEAAAEAAETDNSTATNETAAEQKPADTDASLETDNAPEASPASSNIESPNWVLVQNADKFTVQMSASKDVKSLQAFLTRSGLKAPNSIFSYNRNGSVWYALVHGLYDSIEDARTAVNAMPESARRDKPWVRKVGSIQSFLKDDN